MPEQKDVERPERVIPPKHEELLGAEKEELVERVEALARELQRRMDLEEEILHLNFQKGTASLQAQVEEASRRYRVAQQELEAFRAEVLNAEDGPGRMEPKPFVFENLEGAPAERSDPSQLRALLSVFRRLRGDRDRLQQELERARKEVEQACAHLEEERSRCAKAVEESSASSTRTAALQADHERLERTLFESQAELSSRRQ